MPQLVFGVLINREWARALASQEGIFDALMYARAAEHYGVQVYFFHPRDVDLRRQRVQGWIPQPGERWAKQSVPWPHVFYDQVKLPHLNRTEPLRSVRRRLRQTAIPLNPVLALPKWQTHQALKRYPDTAPLLPHTIICRGPGSMRAMLRQHPAILSKPDAGSWGRGICRISRSGRNRYRLQLSEHNKVWPRLGLLEAYMICTSYADPGRLLLQQEIELAETSQQERSDMRVVISKNRRGEWEMTQGFLRMASPGRFTTNWHQGSRNAPLGEGLPLIVPADEAPAVLADLHQIALLVGSRLEESIGRMSEIGIDLARDKSGRYWLIEANAAPDKGTGSDDIWEPVPRIFLYVLDYALYLWENRASYLSKPSR
ncbi:MAG: hypothetical protein GX060_02150 [Firmicutes bacterium]|nr:hypothetical protein [Bacillota bacterium]